MKNRRLFALFLAAALTISSVTVSASDLMSDSTAAEVVAEDASPAESPAEAAAAKSQGSGSSQALESGSELVSKTQEAESYTEPQAESVAESQG